MAGGLNRHLRDQKTQRERFLESSGIVVAGVSDNFDRKKRSGKMFRPNQFDVNLNKLLDAAEEMHKNSPPADLAEKRREYARKGKEEIAKLITTLFPISYDQAKAARIARSKVFKGEVANGTYYFIDPENAAWVGREVRIQLHLKEMAKKLILAVPEKLDREGKTDLRQRIIDVLTQRKQVVELIAFADEQMVSFTTSRIAELVEALDSEKRYAEARQLLEFSGEAFEVRKLITEKKAGSEATTKTVETIEPELKPEVKIEAPVLETLMLASETAVPVPETPTTNIDDRLQLAMIRQLETPITPVIEVTEKTTPKRRSKK